jgi:TonB family protein
MTAGLRLIRVLLPLVAASLAPAAPPDGAALDALLAKPLSPGSVGLLVEHAADARVVARWREALKDPRPEVRAAAARAVYVTGHGELLPDVSAALAAETDAAAAGEEAEAVAALSGPARDEDLLVASRRLPAALPAVAGALARHRERRALDHAALVEGLTDAGRLEGFVRLATRGDPAALAHAGALALRERREALWEAVLDVARGAAFDEGLLIAGLQAASPGFRAATFWHLVLSPSPPSPRVAAAVEATPEALGQVMAIAPRLAHEMLRRRLGGRAQEDPAWAAALRDGRGSRGLDDDREALRRLTASELAALSERVRGDPGALEKWLRSKPFTPRPGRAGGDPARSVGLRTPDGFPPGLVGDVVRVSGCDPGSRKDAFHGGQVAYRVNGRPQRVTFLPPGANSPECVRAVRALVLLAQGPPDRIDGPGREEMLVVPLVDDVLACMAEPPPPVRPADPPPVPQPVGRGRIEEPKKVRHLAPWYPAVARDNRVEGMVVMEAVISASGCIQGVRLLHSRDPRLDLVSLVTVSQWRYTPTLLDGVPVPVIMTVTVNFRLR